MTHDRYTIAGERVAVRDNDNTGPGIVFLHGNSASSRMFERQFDLGADTGYRMVAPDLPGHGLSDNAEDSRRRYTLRGYAQVVVELLGRLGGARWILVGHSLGGHIALEAIASQADLPIRGLMLVGCPPVRNPASLLQGYRPTPVMQSIFQETLSDRQISQLAAAQVAPGNEIPPFLTIDYRRTDPKCRLELALAVQQGAFTDEITVLEHFQNPIALVAGTSEAIVNLAYLQGLASTVRVWRNGVQLVNDAGHAPQWERPVVFNDLLRRFARHCFENGAHASRGTPP